jgi:predicted Zn-dependent protease with MMP-like domain
MFGMRDDRHARWTRADNDRRRRPPDGFRTRSAMRFERLADDALAALPEPVLEALATAELVLADVPADLELDGDSEVPLAAFAAAEGKRPARLTLYRRPLEARALTKLELVELIRLAAAREVAVSLNLDVDLDDDWE